MTLTNTEHPGYPALLTLLRADQLIREVVAEAGADHVYLKHERAGIKGQCLYVWEGQPDCIVARVLHRHGVPVEELRRWEDIAAGDMHPIAGRMVTPGRKKVGNALMTPEAAQFLGRIQIHQDANTTWGVSVETGMRESREYDAPGGAE